MLVESMDDGFAEATVEAHSGLVRNVALLGPESRNGYRYAHDAMLDAVPLYEGRPVFLNHPIGAGPMARRVQDYVGKIVSPRFEGGRIRADVQLVGPNRSWVVELAESNPADIGMSHVVIARRDRNSDGQDIVESIERVLSVDVVAFPATTQSFAESVDPERLEQAVTHVEQLKEDTDGLEARLEETRSRLERVERRFALDAKLREAGLRSDLITQRWLDQLADLAPEEQDAEIRERRRLGRLVEPEAPVSREKEALAGAGAGEAARRLFVTAVRGR